MTDDDIDVSILQPGFNLNPKTAVEGEVPNADQPLDIYFYAEGVTNEVDGEQVVSDLLGYDQDCFYMQESLRKALGCMFQLVGVRIQKSVR